LSVILGVAILSGGYDIISSRLHDQLQVLALFSVPVIFVLVLTGFILGLIDWLKARKALCRASRMTVAATILNLISMILWIIMAIVTWILFIQNIGGMMA
jgi:hypothetical protein